MLNEFPFARVQDLDFFGFLVRLEPEMVGAAENCPKIIEVKAEVVSA